MNKKFLVPLNRETYKLCGGENLGGHFDFVASFDDDEIVFVTINGITKTNGEF